MKNKTNTLVLLVVFMTVITTASCSENKGWEAAVEKKNGVTVVTNPEEPKYGDFDLGLEEDLSIGKEDDENYRFYGAAGILLDSQENIYALDAGNCRVQKYDRNGEYLLTVGSRGQGPGEFSRPSSFCIDGQNNLYVSEQTKIQVFDSEGEYQKSIPLESRINEFFFDAQGNIITYISINNDEGSKATIVKLDPDGKINETIAEFSDVEAI
jgi:sugar lactone lactonase YvrE